MLIEILRKKSIIGNLVTKTKIYSTSHYSEFTSIKSLNFKHTQYLSSTSLFYF